MQRNPPEGRGRLLPKSNVNGKEDGEQAARARTVGGVQSWNLICREPSAAAGTSITRSQMAKENTGLPKGGLVGVVAMRLATAIRLALMLYITVCTAVSNQSSSFVNSAPSFELSVTNILVLEDGTTATAVARAMQPGPTEVDSEHEAAQLLSFHVHVIEGAWQPLFADAPRVSAAGELTFTLRAQSIDGSPQALQDHEWHSFQLQMTLQDDGGVQDGGQDMSSPAVLDVTVIGTPRPVSDVRAHVKSPLSLDLTWDLHVDALAAQSALAPGRVLTIRVQAHEESGNKVFEAIVDYPASEYTFAGIRAGVEYRAHVAACNALVCSTGTPASEAVQVLDVPSQPVILGDPEGVVRRSSSEIVVFWEPPRDMGDRKPYRDSALLSDKLQFRLQVCQTPRRRSERQFPFHLKTLSAGQSLTRVHLPPAPKPCPDLASSTLHAWADTFVLTAAEFPAVFDSTDVQYLELSFVNAVGSSDVATVEFTTPDLACEPNCGDGLQDISESCDDGNLLDGDGCSATCQREKNYVCTPAPGSTPSYQCQPKLFGRSICVLPAFQSFLLEESTTLPGVANKLLVSFSSNVDLRPGAEVTLSGLVGSNSLDSEAMQLQTVAPTADCPDMEPGNASLVDPQATWMSAYGCLQFRLMHRVPAHTLVSFAVTLDNPSRPQEGQTVLLHCDLCCADQPLLSVKPLSLARAALGVPFRAPTVCSHVNMTSLLRQRSQQGGERAAEQALGSSLTPSGVFGPQCDKLCFGVINGAQCDCLQHHFGDDCSQYMGQPLRALRCPVVAGKSATLQLGSSLPATSISNAHSDAGTSVTLTIPAQALASSMLVRAEVYPAVPRPSSRGHLTPLGNLIQLRPHGMVFATPIRIGIQVPLSSAELAGLQQRFVRVMFFDNFLRRWMPVNASSAIRVEHGFLVLSAETSHLSLWSVMAECAAGYTGALCVACAAGKYKLLPGEGQCSLCPAESFSLAASRARADCKCNAGFTGPDGGTCAACSQGKYKESAGAADCVPCPDGAVSPLASTSSDACVASQDTAFFITLTVIMPYSKVDFDASKQDRYRLAMANAAGTSKANVDIQSITEIRRRATGVSIETKIRARNAESAKTMTSRLGSGDVLLLRINTALGEQGLKDATAISAPTKHWIEPAAASKLGQTVMMWIGVGVGSGSMLALGVCVIAIWVRRRRADAWDREQQTMRQQEEEEDRQYARDSLEAAARRDQAQRNLQKDTPCHGLTADLGELHDVVQQGVQDDPRDSQFHTRCDGKVMLLSDAHNGQMVILSDLNARLYPRTDLSEVHVQSHDSRHEQNPALPHESDQVDSAHALKIESVDFSDNVEENAPDVPAETSRQDVPAETSGQESAGAVERWQAKEERRKRREARAKRKALYARERRSRVFGLNSEAHVQDAEQALQTMIRSSLKGLTSYDAGTLSLSKRDVCFLLPQQCVRINTYPLRCSFTAGLRAFQAVVHIILGF